MLPGYTWVDWMVRSVGVSLALVPLFNQTPVYLLLARYFGHLDSAGICNYLLLL